MPAGIHATIGLDLDTATIDERHRTARVRAQRVTARRTRPVRVRRTR